ncbi:hypothetical protein [Kineosporia sp. NBRC 101731]|uniref:hypothetical protein n=1 Tax=Kineosporia sp. NBRC 101731 TaxID=3032199 RepID=UPI00255286DA|nr:hypothetical protein [Kineosporia sp. NBRC 101731]
MRIPRRAFACLATTFVIATMALLGPAAAASAAPEASGPTCSITPGSITVYDRSKVVEFDVETEYPYWAIGIDYASSGAAQIAPDTRSPLMEFHPGKLANSDAGLTLAEVSLQSADLREIEVCRAPFRLLRGSKISLTAKKVTGGRQLRGRLTQVDFDETDQPYWLSPPWVNHSGQTVRLEHRSGTRWIIDKIVKTGKDGTFKTTVRSGKRTWRAVYAGTPTSGARTSKTVTG